MYVCMYSNSIFLISLSNQIMFINLIAWPLKWFNFLDNYFTPHWINCWVATYYWSYGPIYFAIQQLFIVIIKLTDKVTLRPKNLKK